MIYNFKYQELSKKSQFRNKFNCPIGSSTLVGPKDSFVCFLHLNCHRFDVFQFFPHFRAEPHASEFHLFYGCLLKRKSVGKKRLHSGPKIIPILDHDQHDHNCICFRAQMILESFFYLRGQKYL